MTDVTCDRQCHDLTIGLVREGGGWKAEDSKIARGTEEGTKQWQVDGHQAA